MMIKRCIGYFVGCLILLAPAAGAVAAEGIQLGPTLLFPVLGVTGTYDDNFYLASDKPESGWETKVSPSLRLTMPVQHFYLSAEGGLDFFNYYGIENFYGTAEPNHTDWNVGGAVGADFPGGLSFKIADTYRHQYATATQEFGPGEGTTNNALTAMVAYAIRDALKLEITGGRTSYTYDTSLNREYVQTLVRGGLFWKFRPAISALVEGSYANYAYDSNTAQDSTETGVSLGLTWDVTAKSTGFVKGGYEWKRYDVQAQSLGTEDGSYYTLSGGLRHSFTQRTVLVLDLSHGSKESDFPNNPYYLETKVAANLSQRLTPKLYCRLGASYINAEYPNATSYDNPYDPASGTQSGKRTDDTVAANVSLGLDVTRWLALEVGYEGEWRNSSNFDTFAYDVNRFSLSAKAAF